MSRFNKDTKKVITANQLALLDSEIWTHDTGTLQPLNTMSIRELKSLHRTTTINEAVVHYLTSKEQSDYWLKWLKKMDKMIAYKYEERSNEKQSNKKSS